MPESPVYPDPAYVHADAGDYGPTGDEYTPELSALTNWAEKIAMDATDPVFYRCLVAVANVVRVLDLAGVAYGSVLVRKVPWDRASIKPGIWVCPARETFAPATNQKIGVEYPIDVVMVRVSNQNLTDEMDSFLLWREQIRKAFTQTASSRPVIDTVSETFNVRVESGVVYDHGSFALMHDVGVLRIVVSSREGNL